MGATPRDVESAQNDVLKAPKLGSVASDPRAIDSTSFGTALHPRMDARLCFNLRPPDGKINGVFVNANSPGIAPFTFHAQHGSMKSTVTEESVTGFDGVQNMWTSK